MVEAAVAEAPNRVRVVLREPYAPFLEEVAGGLPILPQHIWARVAEPETYDGPDASLGSGPFTLTEYRSADGTYRLTANPSYFRGAVTVREFWQLNVPPEARIEALEQSQLDLAWSADAAVLDLVRNSQRLKVLETPPMSIVRLAINMDRPPMDRLQVRQALAAAIDRSRIAEVVTHGAPIPGVDSVIPPDSPWFDAQAPTVPYDPARARTMLGGQPLRLELLALPAYREPELLQPMLESVGITLTTRRVDDETRAQLLRDKRFDLALMQHIGVGGDPDFLRRWDVDSESNAAAQGWVFRDAQFSELARAQALARTPAERMTSVRAMQRVLADELPTIPLYFRRFYWVYDSTRLTPMNTWGGLMNGIPLAYNKLVFLKR
jgi:peptide/nickel transport system substrate-binding protein